MPYIPQKDRVEILEGRVPRNKGELNFALFIIMMNYIKYNGESYTNISDTIGAVNDAKDLFRNHRIVHTRAKELEEKQVFPSNRDELVFVLEKYILNFMSKTKIRFYPERNAIVDDAALDAAAEMRRRVLNPYEDKKIKENGDIFEEGLYTMYIRNNIGIDDEDL